MMRLALTSGQDDRAVGLAGPSRSRAVIHLRDASAGEKTAFFAVDDSAIAVDDSAIAVHEADLGSVVCPGVEEDCVRTEALLRT